MDHNSLVLALLFCGLAFLLLVEPTTSGDDSIRVKRHEGGASRYRHSSRGTLAKAPRHSTIRAFQGAPNNSRRPMSHPTRNKTKSPLSPGTIDRPLRIKSNKRGTVGRKRKRMFKLSSLDDKSNSQDSGSHKSLRSRGHLESDQKPPSFRENLGERGNHNLITSSAKRESIGKDQMDSNAVSRLLQSRVSFVLYETGSISFDSVESQTYYIFMHGQDSTSVGNFDLVVEQYFPTVGNGISSETTPIEPPINKPPEATPMPSSSPSISVEDIPEVVSATATPTQSPADQGNDERPTISPIDSSMISTSQTTAVPSLDNNQGLANASTEGIETTTTINEQTRVPSALFTASPSSPGEAQEFSSPPSHTSTEVPSMMTSQSINQIQTQSPSSLSASTVTTTPSSSQVPIQPQNETYSPTTTMGDDGVMLSTFIPSQNAALPPLIPEPQVPPGNDQCSSASFSPIGSSGSGSTIMANSANSTFCNTNSTAPGVWYLLFISSGPIGISFQTNYLAQISIGSGDDCNELTCVATTEGFLTNGTSGFLVFEALETEKYYLYVHGVGSQVGDFNFTILQATPPRNNVCQGAFPISTGVTVEGQMRYATSSDIPSCEFWSGSSPTSGLWYMIEGLGGATLEAVVEATFDVQIVIFGGFNCDEMICVGASENGTTASLSWLAEEGVMYNIFVANADSDLLATNGNFMLTVNEKIEKKVTNKLRKSDPQGLSLFGNDLREGTKEESRYSYVNSKCPEYTELNFGDTIAGSTSMESIIPDNALPSCKHSLQRASWYDFKARGATVEATLQAGFQGRLTVFVGPTCNFLKCVNQVQMSSSHVQSLILYWDTVEGEHYHIAVDSLSSIPGDFYLTVTEKDFEADSFATNTEDRPPTDPPRLETFHVITSEPQAETVSVPLSPIDNPTSASIDEILPPFDNLPDPTQDDFDEDDSADPPPNNSCEESVVLGIDERATGSTALSNVIEIDFCPSSEEELSSEKDTIAARGVWFSVEGTGFPIQVSYIADYDARLTVFAGENCQILTCAVDDTEAAPTIMPSVSTTSGTAPDGDMCENRLLIEIGDTVVGSTLSATMEDVEVCGANTNTAPGVWYYFLGNGEAIRVSFLADYDAQVSVYGGLSCRSLVCIDGTQGDSSDFSSGQVIFDSIVGREYFVFIHGFSSEVGTYEISIETVSRPGNDFCKSAVPLEMGDTVSSSNVLAADDDVEVCRNTVSGGPGVWFSLAGTGNFLNVTIEADYDAQLTVYSGENCGELQCVDGDSGEPPSFSSAFVEWFSDSALTYFLLVNGFYGQTGDFELQVKEGESSIHGSCDQAEALEIGDVVIGTTEFASVDNVELCGGDTNISPGVFYTIVGTGGTIRLAFSSVFDLQLTVFTGIGCQSLVCIATTAGSVSRLSQLFLWDSGSIDLDSEVGQTYYIFVHSPDNSAGQYELSVEEVRVENEAPTNSPTFVSSEDQPAQPSYAPSQELSSVPSGEPSFSAFPLPSEVPNSTPSSAMTSSPTLTPTIPTTTSPVSFLSEAPSSIPSSALTSSPTLTQTETRTSAPSFEPSHSATSSLPEMASSMPSSVQSLLPTVFPTGPLTTMDPTGQSFSDCTTAVAFVIGTTVFGSTTELDTDDVSVCGSSSPLGAGGVWFNLRGNNELLNATLTIFDQEGQLTIYAGTCDDLVCVDGSRRVFTASAIVLWTAEQDVDYYILVQSLSLAPIDFELSIFVVSRDDSSAPSPTSSGLPSSAPSTSSSPMPSAEVTMQPSESLPDESTEMPFAETSSLPTVLPLTSLPTENAEVESSLAPSSPSPSSESTESPSALPADQLLGETSLPLSLFPTSATTTAGTPSIVATAPPSIATSTLLPSPLATTTTTTLLPSSTTSSPSGTVTPNPSSGTSLAQSTDMPSTSATAAPSTITASTLLPSSTTSSPTGIATPNPSSATSMAQSTGMPSTLATMTASTTTISTLLPSSTTSSPTGIVTLNPSLQTTLAPSTDVTLDGGERCTNAVAVETDETISGSITTATSVDSIVNNLGNLTTCGDSSRNLSTTPGLWFSLQGRNELLKARVDSEVPLEVTILSASLLEPSSFCENLACVIGTLTTRLSYFSSITAWETQAQSVYFLFLHAPNEVEDGESLMGSFSLTIESTRPPSNDACSGATPIELMESGGGGTSNDAAEPVTGWTYFASLDRVDDCVNPGMQLWTKGIWYSVQGNGNSYRVSLSATYEGRVSVYLGTSCALLTCVDDGTEELVSMDVPPFLYGGSSSVVDRSFTWSTVTGITYYILVHGATVNDEGEFYLAVSSQ